MNINTFLTCLSFYGFSTGAALEGVYSFNSGFSGIIYNQLYPTSSHFESGYISNQTLPLVCLSDTFPTNGAFTGSQTLHLGYQYTGNFGIVLDVQYTGCFKASNYQQIDYVLFSTVPNHSGLSSGFFVAINDANRLYFGTSGTYKVLNKELTSHDFVYIGISNKNTVNVSIFNVHDNTVSSLEVVSPNILNTPDIFIGGMLSYSDTGNYNGFYGTINEAIFFNNPLDNIDIPNCSNCSLATGYIQTSDSYTVSGIQIIGVTFSGIQGIITSGYSQATGTLINASGSGIPILLSSAITGYVQTGQVALPNYGYSGIPVVRSGLTFLFDPNVMQSFAQYNLQFDLGLQSGDVVEIYTYPQFNNAIGNQVTGFDVPYFTSGVLQLYGNGLSETSGVDYQIYRNFFNGYDTQDVLIYDILNTGTVVSAYSGYWQTSRILMSGGVYYPSAPQYYEPTGINSGQVWITGFSGISTGNPFYPNFGYDVYLNGQKLVSGLQFNISGSGAGFVVALSGSSLPTFDAYGLYDPTGGLPTGLYGILPCELVFMPQFNNNTVYQLFITGTTNLIYNITGYSEQVWVNGLRQNEGFDYIKELPCSFISGIIDAPGEITAQLYNSESDIIGLWNF